MDSMFCYASSYNMSLGKWNVSQVRNMDQIFLGASVFNKNINSWDVLQVNYTSGTLSSAESYNMRKVRIRIIRSICHVNLTKI
jgi:hypothetical protein